MYLIGSQYNIRIFRIMNNLFYNALRVNLITEYGKSIVIGLLIGVLLYKK